MITLNTDAEQFFRFLEVKVREVFANSSQEQCTLKQFDKICSESEILTSKFAETVYNSEAARETVKEQLFSEVVIL